MRRKEGRRERGEVEEEEGLAPGVNWSHIDFSISSFELFMMTPTDHGDADQVEGRRKVEGGGRREGERGKGLTTFSLLTLQTCCSCSFLHSGFVASMYFTITLYSSEEGSSNSRSVFSDS